MSYSDSQTALEGGALGWLKGPSLPTFLAEVVPRMKAGQVSDILQTGSGFHLVKLNEVRSANRHPDHQADASAPYPPQDQRGGGRRDGEAETRPRCARRSWPGADFAVLAKASSADPGSAIDGGDLGWTTLDTFTPEFAKQAEDLKDMEISEPFKTQFGWHIVQMLGHSRFRQHRHRGARAGLRATA